MGIRCSLSALTYDVLGAVDIDATGESRWGRAERRVNRVRTLDGGYALNDGGFADSDRDMQITFSARDPDLVTRVQYLVRYHGQLYLSEPRGYWLVAPRGLEVDTKGRAKLDLLVLERIV